jgi:hypothetical protein
MLFRVYLRSHAPNEVGKIDMASRTVTHNPQAAIIAYRELLARTDLIGQPCAAVLSRDRSALFFSRFDQELGSGRLSADDLRLDPMMDKDEAYQFRS